MEDRWFCSLDCWVAWFKMGCLGGLCVVLRRSDGLLVCCCRIAEEHWRSRISRQKKGLVSCFGFVPFCPRGHIFAESEAVQRVGNSRVYVACNWNLKEGGGVGSIQSMFRSPYSGLVLLRRWVQFLATSSR